MPVIDPEHEEFADVAGALRPRSPAKTCTPGAATSKRIASAARISRRRARRRPTTAIRPPRPPICRPPRPKRCSSKVTRRQVHAARTPSCSAPQMLIEMAKMSLDDGLVMQIHPGAFRNHNRWLFDALRPRQGRRHPAADRLRAGAEAAARSLRQRADADASLCSRWTRPRTAASSRRWPATIRR